MYRSEFQKVFLQVLFIIFVTIKNFLTESQNFGRDVNIGAH